MTTELRISDADRDAVVEQLRRAAADGRLDADELEERIAAALAATTEPELAPLLADLPPERPRRAPRPPRRRGGELRVYLATMAALVVIWALTGMGYFWPVWPALGWGVALAMPGAACGVKHRPAR